MLPATSPGSGNEEMRTTRHGLCAPGSDSIFDSALPRLAVMRSCAFPHGKTPAHSIRCRHTEDRRFSNPARDLDAAIRPARLLARYRIDSRRDRKDVCLQANNRFDEGRESVLIRRSDLPARYPITLFHRPLDLGEFVFKPHRDGKVHIELRER
jgi:hypothetical protein